jgi:hypothetical protein
VQCNTTDVDVWYAIHQDLYIVGVEARPQSIPPSHYCSLSNKAEGAMSLSDLLAKPRDAAFVFTASIKWRPTRMTPQRGAAITQDIFAQSLAQMPTPNDDDDDDDDDDDTDGILLSSFDSILLSAAVPNATFAKAQECMTVDDAGHLFVDKNVAGVVSCTHFESIPSQCKHGIESAELLVEQVYSSLQSNQTSLMTLSMFEQGGFATSTMTYEQFRQHMSNRNARWELTPLANSDSVAVHTLSPALMRGLHKPVLCVSDAPLSVFAPPRLRLRCAISSEEAYVNGYNVGERMYCEYFV